MAYELAKRTTCTYEIVDLNERAQVTTVRSQAAKAMRASVGYENWTKEKRFRPEGQFIGAARDWLRISKSLVRGPDPLPSKRPPFTGGSTKTPTGTQCMDPRIKLLESGKFYTYVKGCPNAVIGTLRYVEDALGLPRFPEASAAKALPADKLFTVRITFQHSTAGAGGDLKYEDIEAGCEIEAYCNARLKAIQEGYRSKLNGFSSFSATPQ